MSDWAMKRFWTAAEVQDEDTGFSVRLDGRGIKTPSKTALVVPTKQLAEAIAEEWQAQTEQIDPGTMPMTRLANSALDKVIPQHAEVAAHLAEYGASDLLCYRADGPDGLVARQQDAWDPWLDWAAQELGTPFATQMGVMPVAQEQSTRDAVLKRTVSLSPFELAGFHDLVALTGSWVLGYAMARQKLDPTTAWDISRVDENWQIEQWGDDEEASELAASKAQELKTAFQFFKSVQVAAG